MECQAERTTESRRPARPPPPVTASSEELYKTFQKRVENGRKYIEKGLKKDEDGHMDEAIPFYQKGLEEVDNALLMNCERMHLSEDETNSFKLEQQKMTKTKLQIEYRLQSLVSQTRTENAAAAAGREQFGSPPSYDEAMSTTSSRQSLSSVSSDTEMITLGDSIMSEELSLPDSVTADASEIFSVREGVQIFFITGEGFVSAPSYPSSLRMFKFTEESEDVNRPPAFMQVGDWLYPLVPGASPALQSNYGAYIFPDVSSQQPGAAVGLMLPDTVHPLQRQQFEEVLGSLTVLREQARSPEDDSAVPTQATAPPMPVERPAPAEQTESKTKPPEQEVAKKTDVDTTSDKISKGILVAADWISWGVGKGAVIAGGLIKEGTKKIQDHINPSSKDHKIDPRVQKGAQYARKATHVAVKVSSFLLSKLGAATAALGKEVAPHLRRGSEKFLPKSMLQSNDGSGKSKLDGVVEVASSTILGFGTVYVSLETAAKSLGRSLASGTTDVVTKRYGEAAGRFAENTIYAVGNVGMTAHTANNFGVKAIAKRAAKDTGKALITDICNKKALDKEEKSSASLYPDLHNTDHDEQKKL